MISLNEGGGSSCHEFMSWVHVMSSCHEFMSWVHVHEFMSWVHVHEMKKKCFADLKKMCF